MVPGRNYQLVETVPPVGYQAPFGQWRITVTSANFPTLPYPTLNIVPIGNTSIPNIEPCGTAPATYFIYNRNDFSLPLSGGRGAVFFTVSGSTVLMLAVIAAIYFSFIRRRVWG